MLLSSLFYWAVFLCLNEKTLVMRSLCVCLPLEELNIAQP